MLLQAFFPKNRGHWKQFSSLELNAIGPRPEKAPFDTRFPQDLTIKKGYSTSEQIGIAMAALVEKGQMELIEWTKQASTSVTLSAVGRSILITSKQILTLCIGHRLRIIEDVDGSSSRTIDLSTMDSDDEDMDAVLGRRGPSALA